MISKKTGCFAYTDTILLEKPHYAANAKKDNAAVLSGEMYKNARRLGPKILFAFF